MSSLSSTKISSDFDSVSLAGVALGAGLGFLISAAGLIFISATSATGFTSGEATISIAAVSKFTSCGSGGVVLADVST